MIMPVQPDHPLLKENKNPQESKSFWSKLHIVAGAVALAGVAKMMISAGFISQILDGKDQDTIVLASGLFSLIAFIFGWMFTKFIFSILENIFLSKSIRIFIKTAWIFAVLLFLGIINASI